MSQAGKGSAPRPFSVSNEEYAARWDSIFARDNEHKTDHSAQKQNSNVTQVDVTDDTLRLADELETEFPHYDPVLEAAAELRRLHAENAGLRDQNTELDAKLAKLERDPSLITPEK
jgi:hypothetical protein